MRRGERHRDGALVVFTLALAFNHSLRIIDAKSA